MAIMTAIEDSSLCHLKGHIMFWEPQKASPWRSVNIPFDSQLPRRISFTEYVII
jgi:hypothetical protein